MPGVKGIDTLIFFFFSNCSREEWKQFRSEYFDNEKKENKKDEGVGFLLWWLKNETISAVGSEGFHAYTDVTNEDLLRQLIINYFEIGRLRNELNHASGNHSYEEVERAVKTFLVLYCQCLNSCSQTSENKENNEPDESLLSTSGLSEQKEDKGSDAGSWENIELPDCTLPDINADLIKKLAQMVICLFRTDQPENNQMIWNDCLKRLKDLYGEEVPTKKQLTDSGNKAPLVFLISVYPEIFGRDENPYDSCKPFIIYLEQK